MEKYYYGGAYYAKLESIDNWERDLTVMKEAGVNFVRTAEIMSSWDRMEPSNNVFDFEKLDAFFDKCAELEIKILLGTGTCSPPYWISKEDPSVNVIDSKHHPFPNNATYGWACYNNKTLQKYAERYITTIVNRYKNKEALLAYQINNEIGYPFMPLQDGQIETYCYCESCQEKYRDFVLDKYQSLEAITEAWSWSTTTTVHTSREDILPPYVKPAAWASVTRWLDWRLFHMDTITNQVKFENEIIKNLDRSHPTVTNIFYLKGQDPMSAITALDQFEVAKHVDIIGYDLYPGSGNKLETRPEFSSMFFAHLASIANPLAKEYWLSEAEGGPINGWVLGPETNTSGHDIERNQLETIGHGCKAILYQLFKEMRFQPLHWGGVINFDGTKTRRFDAVKKIGDFVNDNSNFLTKANNCAARVAILVAKENQIVMNGLNHEKFYMDEIRGVFKYYWQNDIQVEYINFEHVLNGYLNNFELIHIPLLAVFPQAIADALKTYVENGHNIISSARLGYMDEKGWSSYYVPGSKMDEYLGIYVEDVQANYDPIIIYQGEEYYGCYQKETLVARHQENTVLASYSDNSPAVIQYQNKGNWLYFATHLGQSFLKYQQKSIFSAVVTDFLDTINIQGSIKVTFNGMITSMLDAHYLSDKVKAMVVVTHYLNKQEKAEYLNRSNKVELKFDRTIENVKTIYDDIAFEHQVIDGQSVISYEFVGDKFMVLEFNEV